MEMQRAEVKLKRRIRCVLFDGSDESRQAVLDLAGEIGLSKVFRTCFTSPNSNVIRDMTFNIAMPDADDPNDLGAGNSWDGATYTLRPGDLLRVSARNRVQIISDPAKIKAVQEQCQNIEDDYAVELENVGYVPMPFPALVRLVLPTAIELGSTLDVSSRPRTGSGLKHRL